MLNINLCILNELYLEYDGNSYVLFEEVLLEVVAPVLGGHIRAGLDAVGRGRHLTIPGLWIRIRSIWVCWQFKQIQI